MTREEMTAVDVYQELERLRYEIGELRRALRMAKALVSEALGEERA